MLPRTFVATAIFLSYANAALAADGVLRDSLILKLLFKPSIVKIEVQFKNSIIENGKEVCSSEGTGFIFDDKHVITATHVFSFNRSCGAPSIFARTYYGGAQWHLDEVDHLDDVALLQIDSDGPNLMSVDLTRSQIAPCAIDVNPNNVYNLLQDEATRYGIPAGRPEATPVPVEVGSADNEFKPLVKITPTPLNSGESGGPVVAGARVVGIVRSTVVQTDMIGLITPAEQIHKLLQKHRVEFNPDLMCNISKVIFISTNTISSSGGAFGISRVFGSVAVKANLIGEKENVPDDLRVILKKVVSDQVGGAPVRFSDTPIGINFEVFLPGAGHQGRADEIQKRVLDIQNNIGVFSKF